MKKQDVQIGRKYLAKVSDKVVAVRIDGANPHGGWDATNLTTNKKVRIKSAQRLRGPAPDRHAASQHAQAVAAADQENARLPDERQANADGQTASERAMAKSKAAQEPKEKKPSGLDAAYQVLKDAGQPMRCGDVVQKMLDGGMWKTAGKTPAATIYAAIVREIADKGATSRFKKLERGVFTVNA